MVYDFDINQLCYNRWSTAPHFEAYMVELTEDLDPRLFQDNVHILVNRGNLRRVSKIGAEYFPVLLTEGESFKINKGQICGLERMSSLVELILIKERNLN